MENVQLIPMDDEPVYQFPKRFARRKRMSALIMVALFYGSLLVGLALSGPGVWSDTQLVLYLFLFLSAVMVFFMLLVLSSRPWILVFRDRIQVGRHEFPIDRLKSVAVYVDPRMMFERPPYQLIFLVEDPLEGQAKYTSEAIRNVQDVDTIVRDLRRLLPGVEFVDRTLTGGSAVGPEMLEAMGARGDD